MTSQGVREQQYRDQRAALQDQFGNWAFDENGYLPEAPGRRVGMEAQYATNRYTAARNRESREAAIGAMRKGMGLLESYRPGGQASLASGMYQGLAEYHYRNQVEAPDQLAKWRDSIRQKAQHRATQARTMQAVAAAVAGVATMGVGLAAGAGLGMAAMGGLSTAAGTMAGGAGGGGNVAGAFVQGGMQPKTQQQPGVATTAAPTAGIPGQSPEQQFLGGAPAGFYGAPGGGGGMVGGPAQQQQGGQKRISGGGLALPPNGQQGAAQGGGPQVQRGGGGAPGAQGGSAMSRGGAFGLAPEAPEAPMTAHGLPATPAAYMVGEESAPQHAAYWQSQLDGLDSFFGDLMQMVMR